jgi:hypothetical protein
LINTELTLFCLQIKCVGCSACGLQTSVTGILSDGSGSADYLNNAHCEWVIAPPVAQGMIAEISIKFLEFSTQESFDYVIVSACNDLTCPDHGQQMNAATLSGTTTSQAFTFYGIVRVKFITDSSITGGGFTLNWTSTLVSDTHSLVAHVVC